MKLPCNPGKLGARPYRASILQAISTSQIRAAFPQARHSNLGIPPLEHVDWGVLDYFGWIHPDGHRGYVMMPIQDELIGISMRRMLHNTGRPRTHMCSWCNHVYRGRGTAMFSVQVKGSDGRRSIGNHICQNLDCSIRIRNLSSDPPTYLPETIELQHKVWRLQSAVTAFMARANLLTDLI